MKKTLFFISLSLASLTYLTAQEIVISSGANIQVAAGASLNVDGLELAPSVSFSFTENTFTKSSTAIMANSNESMDRVYTLVNPVI